MYIGKLTSSLFKLGKASEDATPKVNGVAQAIVAKYDATGQPAFGTDEWQKKYMAPGRTQGWLNQPLVSNSNTEFMNLMAQSDAKVMQSKVNEFIANMNAATAATIKLIEGTDITVTALTDKLIQQQQVQKANSVGL